MPRVCPGEDRERSGRDEGSVPENGGRTVQVGGTVSPRDPLLDGAVGEHPAADDLPAVLLDEGGRGVLLALRLGMLLLGRVPELVDVV